MSENENNEFEFQGFDQPEYDEESRLVISKYGFLPTSIWNITKSKRWLQLIRDWGDPTGKKRKDPKTKKEMDIKYSEFNPDVADRIIRFWSEQGDQILDPFGGRATRAVVSSVLGRKYLGFEIAPSTQKLTIQRVSEVEEALAHSLIEENFVQPEIRLGDGTLLEGVPNNFADFVFTCPPYSDVEKYESVPGQLSDLSYSDFIQAIARCMKRCFECLKSGKFCVWVVADFRRDKRLIPFHYDLVNAASNIGFHLHDEVIMQNRSPFARYLGNAVAGKHTAKVHEYILVWKKP